MRMAERADTCSSGQSEGITIRATRAAARDENEADMSASEKAVDAYSISTDKARLDAELIHEYLSRRSYWAEGRSLEVVRRSIEHSLCFGVYRGEKQVGFARVVTDYATFGWLCDVFILESHRGRGLGKRLVERVAEEPDLRGLAIFVLATRDAHRLYREHGGFELLDSPERWMIKRAGEKDVPARH